MTHEQHVSKQFTRAVLSAPSMESRVTIDGLQYVVGDMLHDFMDVDAATNFRDELLSVVVKAAICGDETASRLIERMADHFAFTHCPPEPEPYELPEPRGEYDSKTDRVYRFLSNSL